MVSWCHGGVRGVTVVSWWRWCSVSGDAVGLCRGAYGLYGGAMGIYSGAYRKERL